MSTQTEARTSLERAIAERSRGESQLAVDSLREALSLDDELRGAYLELGNTLTALKLHRQAAETFTQGLEKHPNDTELLTGLGSNLIQLGRTDSAHETYERAVQITPDSDEANVGLVRCLIAQGRGTDALASCDRFFSRFAPTSVMLAGKVAAQYAAGDVDGAHEMMHFSQLVRWQAVREFSPYSSLEAFNNALENHLSAHPTLSRNPVGKTTRGGFQTGELLVEPKGPIEVLERCVRQAVDAYLNSLDRDSPNPFCRQPFEINHLSAWGVILEDDGHQLPHYHPAAWISAVYYVRMPEARSPHGGSIEFGPPIGTLANSDPQAFHAAKPQVGQLVVFPAYFFHGTVPTGSRDRRVCIAFDIS